MKPDLSTRCVHAGEPDDPHGSPHAPLYTTTTFKFSSTAALLDVVEGRRPGALYTRYGLNPTIQALEEKLAAIEGAEAALAFASGMAAESALFLAHGRKGIVCLGDAYGAYFEREPGLPVLAVDTTRFHPVARPADVDRLMKAIDGFRGPRAALAPDA